MNLSDWKGLSQDLPLHTPHVRVGSAGEGISLEIPAHLRPFEGKQVFSFVSPSTAAAHLLQSGTLLPYCHRYVFHHIIAL